MANVAEHPQPETTSEGWATRLALHRKEAGYALLALSAAFALAALIVGLKYHAEGLAVILWCGLIALALMASGLLHLAWEPADLSPEDSARLRILVTGGAVGLVTVLVLGLGLTWTWWSTISGGWEAWQGKEGWRVGVCILAILGGLALMFVSLQAARPDEHSGSTFRRRLYAYNVVLTGLLMVLILAVVNLLVYIPWGPFAWFNRTYNPATSSIYSLSPQSEKILESLKKPVKIYALIPRNDELYTAVHALLNNVQSVNSRIQVQYLSPDLDRDEVERLVKDYKFGGERRGILIVYGTPPGEENRFLKYSDLISTSADFMAREKQPIFKGEMALLNEINALAEGKEKPVVYFLQGDGELDISDNRPESELDQGAGALRERLQGSNYTIKGLQLSPIAGLKSKSPDVVVATAVPSDAATVVIAGPRQRLNDAALKALRDYMTPKGTDASQQRGKLVILLDLVTNPDGTMLETGLEGFLAEFDIQVGNDRILHPPNQIYSNPEWLLVTTNPEESVRRKNPIADAFYRQTFTFLGARTVRPQPVGAGGATHYRADTLMVPFPGQYAWAESNLKTNARQLVADLLKRPEELAKRISEEPLPVAVAVTESIPSAEGGPHAMMNAEDRPRLVVFGDATWVCNRLMNDRAGGLGYDLFASTLAWLRERPSNIGIEPKKPDYYPLRPDMPVGAMLGLPLFLMLFSVLGLGAGVWLVRRR